jgi:PAS domain S-box-containing protein
VTRFPTPKILTLLHARGLAKYALELLVIGAAYFALAKFDLTLAAIHPSIPISSAAGFALAAVLLRGLRIWPAILAAALAAVAPAEIADVTLADAILKLSIAAGNALEAVFGGYLINVWSDGVRAFETPAGVAKFALVSLAPSTMLGATIGVGGMCLAGDAAWASFAGLWVTSWLRDAIGALVLAPVIVLWAIGDFRTVNRDQGLHDQGLHDQGLHDNGLFNQGLFGKQLASGTAFLAASVVGFLAFSPLLEPTVNRGALGILAVSPLLWAALRCSQRDTAACTLILAGFATWGAGAGSGPFATTPYESLLNEPFLTSTLFLISTSILGLVLSADIAQRQRVKDRLRRQEQNLRALLSHADMGIAQIDTTGRFKLVNSRYCDIVRRPAPELLQSRIQDLIDADDLSRMLGLLGHATHTGESFVIETRTVLSDGTRLWVRSTVAAIFDQSGAVHYLVAVAEDVTARRDAEENLMRENRNLLNTVRERTETVRKASEVLHAEVEQRKRVEDALAHDIAERRKTQEALIESEWRFRMVIQGITDYAIFMLDRDGCVTNWNLGAQRIHQYTAAETIGRHFSRFYSEAEQQGGEPARALQTAAYEGKYAVEGWRVRRDESGFWASVVIEAIRDEVGTLVGFVNITRDITERREAQASLERAQEQLAQSQKMEALGQLTGSIAHDFNNLLMIVSGHAQLLRRRLTDPKHLQAIDAVHSAANRGESLTRQLLAFSRRQPINPVVADLKERIDAVHDMLVGSLRGNVALKCDIAADVWPVEVDIAELELALVNVAVNARDAMPGGGVITLSALNVTLRKSDGVDQLEGDFVALAMTDTGVGIAPDVLPRIFEPFFTTKALGKGTGLGLAQVYGFSHQSGGTVVATSTVGSGTAITIYLPRKHAALVKAVAAPPTQPIVAGHGTILMVEDNAEVADVTASLLEQLGYQVVRADNATDALNKLQRGDNIILVFSDIVMPGSMNGIALAQEIGNRYPQIPVLLTSGYSDVVQTAASQLRILRKPFQLPALEKSIRDALEHARARDTDDRVLQFPPRRHGQGAMNAR